MTPARRCSDPAGALRRRPVRQPRHAAARLRPRWRRISPSCKAPPTTAAPAGGLSPEKLVAQIAALQRELAAGAAAQSQPKKAPRPICTTSWPSIRTYERRLVAMIQDQESPARRRPRWRRSKSTARAGGALEGADALPPGAGAHRAQYRRKENGF
ncbi:primosomal replication protein [Serratia ureilytica]